MVIYLWSMYSPNQSFQLFKRSTTSLNSEFSFSSTGCRTEVKELCLIYCLPIAGRRIVGFIPFLRVYAGCEMPTASTRFWTQIADFIPHSNKCYVTSIRNGILAFWIQLYLIWKAGLFLCESYESSFET